MPPAQQRRNPGLFLTVAGLGLGLALARPAAAENLPLAAVLAGAPVVGGALFIADRLFGDALDRVTRIHYRVRGPWTAPQISVESAE